MVGAFALSFNGVYAESEQCDADDRDSRTRESRDSNRSTEESCPDPSDPPPTYETDLVVFVQNEVLDTHVLPGTGSVSLTHLVFDASNSGKDIHIPSLEFEVDITSFDGFSNLENCGIYQGRSEVEASGVSRATVTNSGDNVITSHAKFSYSFPPDSLVAPHHDTTSVSLVCDFPPALTEAQVTTVFIDDDFSAIDSDDDAVDFTIVLPLDHTIDVYAGDTPPWDSETPPDDPPDGGDGEDGEDGEKGEDGDPQEEEEESPNRRDRTDQTDRR